MTLAIIFGIVMSLAALVGIVIFACLLSWFMAQAFDAIAKAQAETDFTILYRRLLHALQSSKEVSSDAPEPILVVLGRDVLAQTKFLSGVANGDVVFDRSRDAAKKLHLDDTLALQAWMRLLEERHGMSDVFVLYAERRRP